MNPAFPVFPHFSLLVAWTGLVASQFHLGPSDYLIIVGALGFAYSSLRAGRMKVLRETNKDLVDRNTMLEKEATDGEVELNKLRAQSNEEIARLLVALTARIESHDMTMRATAEKQQELIRANIQAQDEVTLLLRAISVAVIPPN